MLRIAERLRKMRLQKDLNQKSVALYVPISEDSVSAYERGVRQPSLDTVCKLADLYQTSTDYLLGRTGVEVPYPKTLQEMYELTPGELDLVSDMVRMIILAEKDRVNSQNITRKSGWNEKC